MNAARAAILRQSTQANDETYYLWSMRFFMAFCRLYRFRPQYLRFGSIIISLLPSESLSVSIFHWVYTLSMGYREALLTDKRGGCKNQKALQYSRRLALAVSAYRQFLLCVQEMFAPSKETVDKLREVDLDDDGDDVGGEVETVEERLRIQKQAAETLMCKLASKYNYIINSLHQRISSTWRNIKISLFFY